jgi:predicted HAD superfamily Cof-like phosphohydrolase
MLFNKFFNCGDEPASSFKKVLPLQFISEFLEEMRNAMYTNFDKVRIFMEVMGQEVKETPEFPSQEIIDLRLRLIEEEVAELRAGVEAGDLVNVAKELTDILYVVYGMGHSLGINLDACFEEVQQSNLSKLDDEGNPILRESDGKVMKGPNYFEPDIESVIY